jgi:hypothetical protein
MSPTPNEPLETSTVPTPRANQSDYSSSLCRREETIPSTESRTPAASSTASKHPVAVTADAARAHAPTWKKTEIEDIAEERDEPLRLHHEIEIAIEMVYGGVM